MPRTARQILIAQGYTEAELANHPLLADARFVRALEQEDAGREAALAQANGDLENVRGVLKRTEDWYNNTAIPEIEKSRRETVASRARAAQLEAQMKAEQEMGLRRVAEDQGQQNQLPVQPQQPSNDPDPRYVTSDHFTGVVDKVGDAMAIAADIPFEHQQLFGKPLEGGVRKLRNDYVQARKNNHFQGDIYEYWQQTHKVADRRTAIDAEAKAKAEADIRADERRKVMSESGNPNTAVWQSSRAPFARRVSNGTDSSGKLPWDSGSREDRAQQRVVKFGQKELASRAG